MAIALAAADTYVVVLALPDMMSGVGLSIDDLTRATPIVSAFLLGYVALLPLVGRIADARGRVQVLVAGLTVFAAGSLVTFLTTSLGMLEAGRFLQGLGGGALVPATLALAADLYPRDRLGLPLGLISGVQELGSVIGPLLGALILTAFSWRGIFAANLLAAVVLAILIAELARRSGGLPRPSRPDPIGVVLVVVAVAGMALMWIAPEGMKRSLFWGELYIPRIGSSVWTTWLGWITIAALLGLVARCWLAGDGPTRPLVDLRSWVATLLRVDLLGAFLLGLALTAIILAFAGSDVSQTVLAPYGGVWLAVAAAAVVFLLEQQRRTPAPLIARGLLRPVPAWGSLLVSLITGGALVGALLDVPLFARTTVDGGSQVRAALVLVRLLVAIPVGAVAGGWLSRRMPLRVVASMAMLIAAAGFWGMARWDAAALTHPSATVWLVVCGLGFGLALAPLNTAALGASSERSYALMASLVVAARMIGMLVGLSVLTALGLHAYDTKQAALPPISAVCPRGDLCHAYTALLKTAAISQEHTVFADAAVAAVLAAVLSLALLRRSQASGDSVVSESSAASGA